jgi:hypothetical protein
MAKVSTAVARCLEKKNSQQAQRGMAVRLVETGYRKSRSAGLSIGDFARV